MGVLRQNCVKHHFFRNVSEVSMVTLFLKVWMIKQIILKTSAYDCWHVLFNFFQIFLSTPNLTQVQKWRFDIGNNEYMFPRNFFQKIIISWYLCLHCLKSRGWAEFSKVSRASEHGFVNKEKDLQTAKPPANCLSTKQELCTIIKKQYGSILLYPIIALVKNLPGQYVPFPSWFPFTTRGPSVYIISQTRRNLFCYCAF